MNKRSRDLDYLDHIANRIRRIERVTAGVDLAGFVGMVKDHMPTLLTAIERLQHTLRLASNEPQGTQEAGSHQGPDQ